VLGIGGTAHVGQQCGHQPDFRNDRGPRFFLQWGERIDRQEVGRAVDGRQRISQLVGDHRGEVGSQPSQVEQARRIGAFGGEHLFALGGNADQCQDCADGHDDGEPRP